jgi:hypothetical protein
MPATLNQLRQILNAIDWQHPLEQPVKIENLCDEPTLGVGFAELPGYAMNKDSYTQASKDFFEQLYRDQQLELLYCKALDQWSNIDESEGDFRLRIAIFAKDASDKSIEATQEKASIQRQKLIADKEAAEASLAKQKVESTGAVVKVGARLFGNEVLNLLKKKWPFLGTILGRKTTSRTSTSTTINEATQAYKQHGDVKVAEDKVASIGKKMEELDHELDNNISRIKSSYMQEALQLKTDITKPSKADIRVEEVCLVWIPVESKSSN